MEQKFYFCRLTRVRNANGLNTVLLVWKGMKLNKMGVNSAVFTSDNIFF